MNILVLGSSGFIGKNLVERLKTIQESDDGYNIENIFEYDSYSNPEMLDVYCKEVDFVYNLAGVSRPDNEADFYKVNYEFAKMVSEKLKTYDNKCPIMLASSVQASLVDRYSGSLYGESKALAENEYFKYKNETNSEVYVFRFPNTYGKWARPNYCSVVANFCYNISHDIPIVINDKNTVLELLYIDDLVDVLIDLLCGNAKRCEFDGLQLIPCESGKFCYVSGSQKISLGQLADIIYEFKNNGMNDSVEHDPFFFFKKKLYATYQSYIKL